MNQLWAAVPHVLSALCAFQLQRFGSAGDSHVHPAIAIAMLIAVAFVFILKRKFVIVPLLVAGLLIPMDQVLVIGGLHFQMIRLLILFGWTRVLLTRSSSEGVLISGGIRKMDVALLLSASIAAIDTVLLWQDQASFTNQLGTLYTILGLYFLLRCLLRSSAELILALKTLAFVCGIVAVIMTLEQITGHNPYAYVWAGASSGITVMERDGHRRAMACFAHPLLAGSFGGITLPLFFGLWWKDRRSRLIAVLGMIATTVIVWAANSSTPLLAYLGALLAICLWPVRKRMRMLRWALLITLTSLHLVMKAPVWALIARVDVTGSSSGYHRYQLVDQFIRRFGDWWLIGTKGNSDWGWDMWDLANQYVAVGETSGLIPFLCFLAIIVFAFKDIGRARAKARDRKDELLLWALGAALFANVVGFFGISYFDQTMVAWYLLLAMIPAACADANVTALATVRFPGPKQIDVRPRFIPVSQRGSRLQSFYHARQC